MFSLKRRNEEVSDEDRYLKAYQISASLDRAETQRERGAGVRSLLRLGRPEPAKPSKEGATVLSSAAGTWLQGKASVKASAKRRGRRWFPSVWVGLLAAVGILGVISLLAVSVIFVWIIAPAGHSKPGIAPRPKTETVQSAPNNSRATTPARLPLVGTTDHKTSRETQHTPATNVIPSGRTGPPGVTVSEVKGPPAYILPRPLKQVLPDISQIGPDVIEGPTRVEVLVRIDERGRVTNALITNSSQLPESLANAVLVAAKRWTFAPATLSGKPVESDHTIVFQFGSPRAK